MAFEFAYPSHTAPTPVPWQPSGDPAVSGSQQTESSGYQAEAMSDQKTQYAYRYSAAFKKYQYAFTDLTSADKAAFETFVAAALGNAFEFREDATCGGVLAWTKVKFDPTGYERTWRPTGGERWGVTIVLRDSN